MFRVLWGTECRVRITGSLSRPSATTSSSKNHEVKEPEPKRVLLTIKKNIRTFIFKGVGDGWNVEGLEDRELSNIEQRTMNSDLEVLTIIPATSGWQKYKYLGPVIR